MLVSKTGEITLVAPVDINPSLCGCIIRWLRRSECVVDNPEEANLFLFPYYDTCYKALPRQKIHERLSTCLVRLPRSGGHPTTA